MKFQFNIDPEALAEYDRLRAEGLSIEEALERMKTKRLSPTNS